MSIVNNKNLSMVQTSVMNFVRNRSKDSATSSNIRVKFLPIQSAPRKYISEGWSEDSTVWRDRQTESD
jgi:hypothetical protein